MNKIKYSKKCVLIVAVVAIIVIHLTPLNVAIFALVIVFIFTPIVRHRCFGQHFLCNHFTIFFN